MKENNDGYTEKEYKTIETLNFFISHLVFYEDYDFYVTNNDTRVLTSPEKNLVIKIMFDNKE